MHSQAARPMVKAGKMMWNETVNANWMRDSNIAVTSGITAGDPCQTFSIFSTGAVSARA